jgi:uncharacterized protein (TIGR02246 family)
VAGLTPEDREAIRDRIGRYAWALDTGDAAGVAACFTPDGVAVDSQGNRYTDIRAFADAFIGREDFRGRKHLINHLFLEGDGERCVATSYWTVVKWYFSEQRMAVVATGYSLDTMARGADGDWLIAERVIRWFSDQHGPWVGPGPQSDR